MVGVDQYMKSNELLRFLLLSPRGNFVDYDFHKAYHLTSVLKHISPLAAGELQRVNYVTPDFFF